MGLPAPAYVLQPCCSRTSASGVRPNYGHQSMALRADSSSAVQLTQAPPVALLPVVTTLVVGFGGAVAVEGPVSAVARLDRRPAALVQHVHVLRRRSTLQHHKIPINVSDGRKHKDGTTAPVAGLACHKHTPHSDF